MSEWHYSVDGVQQGPVSIDDLRRFVAEKRLTLDDFAWKPGRPEWQPLRDIVEVSGEPPLFAVGIVKLIAMTFLTFGLYEIYWMYRQWQRVRATTGEDLMPFWRAVFGMWWFYALIGEMNGIGRERGVAAELPAGPLAVLFFLLNVLWRLPDPYWLISFATILPISIVQARANEINGLAAPFADRNTRIRGWNWLAVVLGIPFFGLVLLGLFFAE